MQDIINKIHFGDCLEIMSTWPIQSVDAVITDPPYMIGSSSIGSPAIKAKSWADVENSAYWYAAWIREARRLLTPTGWLLMFGNWRSLPVYQKALSMADAPANSCMIWDKLWIGTGHKSALRGRYEIILFSGMEEAIIQNRSASDVYSLKWQAGNMRTTAHPAEKPVEIMEYLCNLVCPSGGVILDPFAGSGTTCVGAKIAGCDFIGIEAELSYYKLACGRVGVPTLVRD